MDGFHSASRITITRGCSRRTEILRDHDGDFAGIELDCAPHRVNPDALDELLDQCFVEELSAQLVHEAERVRGSLLRIRTRRCERRKAVDEPRDRALYRDLFTLET